MKLSLIFLFLFSSIFTPAQEDFNHHFTNDVLRIDFYLAGDKETEEVYLSGLIKEKQWAGPVENYLEPFDYGNYRILVKSLNGKLLYKKGFSTLFEEYQTTEAAKKEKRCFYQTVRVPYPRDSVVIKLQKRKFETGEFVTLIDKIVDPDDYFIEQEKSPGVKYDKIQSAGEPQHNVDIAFLAEGYTEDQMEKFVRDVRKMIEYIFKQQPIKKYKEHFNIYAVKSISEESGTDIPGERIYRQTALNTSYYTFDVPRYLTTFDTKTIRDYASVVPYDHIFILINTRRYGGGGFYNHYTATTTNHAYSKEVAIHEFGHGFVGLGDEYYNSNVAYSNFYNTEVEPWEPNLTTLVNFESKWKEMVKENTPVPTPREDRYKSTIGVFEGGGYVLEGVYSPFMDCRMKSNTSPGFCPVCKKAVEKMILFYMGELE